MVVSTLLSALRFIKRKSIRDMVVGKTSKVFRRLALRAAHR